MKDYASVIIIVIFFAVLISKDDTATIVVGVSQANRLLIPASVNVISGGEGIVLQGPKQEIVKLHRKAWNLDD